MKQIVLIDLNLASLRNGLIKMLIIIFMVACIILLFLKFVFLNTHACANKLGFH